MAAFQEKILFNSASLYTVPLSNKIRISIELLAIEPHGRWHDDDYDLRSYEHNFAAGFFAGVGPGANDTLALILKHSTILKLIPLIRGCARLAALGVCFPVQLFTLLLQRILPEHGSII